ncbi:MAG: glycosyltransferase family 2 protein [Planctomycetales bacterium]|nr:glycosyltransferase family 2 protein [Planctomycetales bacterium]
MTHEAWDQKSDRSTLSVDAAHGSAPVARISARHTPWQERLVIGITAFRRPQHLQRLVASIRKRYPTLPIVVADNGDDPATLPADVHVLRLPFDCGLSKARNALVAATDHEYFLLLEEDFCFTAETRLEDFVEILEQDPEIGVVGGALFCNGIKQEYSVRVDRLRDKLRFVPAVGDYRITQTGVTYQLCDMCFNFALFRRAMLRDHRWNEQLKLGEHYAYYDVVRRAGLWRVANCDSVRAVHDMSDRDDRYLRFRRRGREMHLEYLRSIGVNGIEADPRIQLRTTAEDTADRPNVVILGVGHSGTSILAKLLGAAGWKCHDADPEFQESITAREVNIDFLERRDFDVEKALSVIDRAGPWLLKDPRFVFTLGRWKALFARQSRQPTLVWITRELPEVIASYRRRGELLNVDADRILQKRFLRAERQFEDWPWAKLKIRYEDLQGCAQFLRESWRYSGLAG